MRRLETRVELLQAYTGMNDRLVRALVGDGARGLALVAFGRGNVPPSIVPALAEAVDAGVLVTVSSRCVAGRVRPRYGYDGGGLHLSKHRRDPRRRSVGREGAAAADGRARRVPA